MLLGVGRLVLRRMLLEIGGDGGNRAVSSACGLDQHSHRRLCQ